MTSTSNTFGTLCNYRTGDAIRPATSDELLESRDAASADGGAGVIEADGTICYVEGGDDFIAATDYLDNIPETEWEVIIGTQSREEFAELAIEAGQTIEEAWTEAVAHAESL